MFTHTRNKHHIITPLHHRASNKENKENNQRQKDQNTQTSSPPLKNTNNYKRLHRNACRTKVTQFLEYRSQKLKICLKPSLWLISKTYLKKLATIPICSEQKKQERPTRKISWSQEAECVYFNERKNSASVSEASRHLFSLQDERIQ